MIYGGLLQSIGNSVLFRKRGKKLSKCISTFPLQIRIKTIWIYNILHVKLGPCYNSARKFKVIRVISDENFFLKTKNSLFSLLCIVHINLAYQNVITLPNVK